MYGTMPLIPTPFWNFLGAQCKYLRHGNQQTLKNQFAASPRAGCSTFTNRPHTDTRGMAAAFTKRLCFQMKCLLFKVDQTLYSSYTGS